MDEEEDEDEGQHNTEAHAQKLHATHKERDVLPPHEAPKGNVEVEPLKRLK